MSATLAAPRFPQDFATDTGFVEDALSLFRNQSGLASTVQFADLSLCEQHIVLHLAQALKKEAAQLQTAREP